MIFWVVSLYALLVAAGGLIGFIKAGSSASLVAGLGAGLILGGSVIAMTRGAFQPGWWVALVVTLLLLARFGMAAAREFKLMPGGLVIIMSVIVLITLLTNRGNS